VFLAGVWSFSRDKAFFDDDQAGVETMKNDGEFLATLPEITFFFTVSSAKILIKRALPAGENNTINLITGSC
jgi:hypothetical protein